MILELTKRKNIVFLLLTLLTLVQFTLFITRPTSYQYRVARDSIFSLVSSPGAVYNKGINRDFDPMYKFAQKVNEDIPKGARVLYINDADDGSELEKYFRINFWMPSPHQNAYQFKHKPNKQEVIKMMKENNSQYLITYNGNLPTYSLTGNDSIQKRGKLFEFKGNDLIIVKEYD